MLAATQTPQSTDRRDSICSNTALAPNLERYGRRVDTRPTAPFRPHRPAWTTSVAARSPDDAAPLIEPYQINAVSPPAQWTRPNGARIAGPNPDAVSTCGPGVPA